MDDVVYYDSQLQYQKRVGEIEKERLQLEREMFSMMRSDKKLQNLRVVKLKSYWQHACEREKKARERNEDLLSDFEQLEIQLSAMEAKTNKLRKMKFEYDEKVKRMYPIWRQEVELARVKRQLQDRGINITLKQKPIAQEYSHTTSQSTMHGSSPTWQMKQPAQVIKGQENVQKAPKAHGLSRSKTPESIISTNQNPAIISVATPTITPVTSTPKSMQSPVRLSEQASVQPPPDSFADTTPQKMQPITSTSPIDFLKKKSSVVHTIPTALSSDGGNSDFSDTSVVSDKPVGVAGSVTDAHHIPARTGALSPQQKSPKKENTRSVSELTHTDFSPTSSKEFHHSERGRGNKDIDVAKSPPMGSRISPRSSHSGSPVKAVLSQNSDLRSPEAKSENRISISSFGSDEISPRSNASPRSNISPSNPPLTANAAYQALLKQHSGVHRKKRDIPEIGEESDEDDLENLLSPHGTGKFGDDQSSNANSDDSISEQKEQAPVYIPTAVSSGHSSQPRNQLKSRTVPKAPWDTDTEDEFENEDTNLSNTAGSSMWEQKLKKYDPQDDFDFYD